MKRSLLVGAMLLTGGMAFAQAPGAGPDMQDGYRHGPPPHAQHASWREERRGGPPEFMGMIPERAPAIQKLPQDKRDALHALQSGARKQLVDLRAKMERNAVTMGDVLQKFPLDEEAANKAETDLNKVRAEMFDLHMRTLAKAQQIIGKDAWDALQADREQWHRRGHGGPDRNDAEGHGPEGRGPDRTAPRPQ